MSSSTASSRRSIRPTDVRGRQSHTFSRRRPPGEMQESRRSRRDPCKRSVSIAHVPLNGKRIESAGRTVPFGPLQPPQVAPSWPWWARPVEQPRCRDCRGSPRSATEARSLPEWAYRGGHCRALIFPLKVLRGDESTRAGSLGKCVAREHFVP